MRMIIFHKLHRSSLQNKASSFSQKSLILLQQRVKAVFRHPEYERTYLFVRKAHQTDPFHHFHTQLEGEKEIFLCNSAESYQCFLMLTAAVDYPAVVVSLQDGSE